MARRNFVIGTPIISDMFTLPTHLPTYRPTSQLRNYTGHRHLSIVLLFVDGTIPKPAMRPAEYHLNHASASLVHHKI